MITLINKNNNNNKKITYIYLRLFQVKIKELKFQRKIKKYNNIDDTKINIIFYKVF